MSRGQLGDGHAAPRRADEPGHLRRKPCRRAGPRGATQTGAQPAWLCTTSSRTGATPVFMPSSSSEQDVRSRPGSRIAALGLESRAVSFMHDGVVALDDIGSSGRTQCPRTTSEAIGAVTQLEQWLSLTS
jgi:hypothetical protein